MLLVFSCHAWCSVSQAVDGRKCVWWRQQMSFLWTWSGYYQVEQSLPSLLGAECSQSENMIIYSFSVSLQLFPKRHIPLSGRHLLLSERSLQILCQLIFVVFWWWPLGTLTFLNRLIWNSHCLITFCKVCFIFLLSLEGKELQRRDEISFRSSSNVQLYLWRVSHWIEWTISGSIH